MAAPADGRPAAPAAPAPKVPFLNRHPGLGVFVAGGSACCYILAIITVLGAIATAFSMNCVGIAGAAPKAPVWSYVTAAMQLVPAIGLVGSLGMMAKTVASKQVKAKQKPWHLLGYLFIAAACATMIALPLLTLPGIGVLPVKLAGQLGLGLTPVMWISIFALIGASHDGSLAKVPRGRQPARPFN